MTLAGRTVPTDVSVVGFDDIPTAAYLNPPLTTIAQPFDAHATAGLSALVRGIEDPDAQPAVEGSPAVDLVVRGTTAPYPQPRPDSPH
jgi:DNA-binding LacI/PurR family transcriptional regulator